MDSSKQYTVLIRTYNSALTLPQTLASLKRQVCQPTAYIIVDSGSTDNTLQQVPVDAFVHRYVGREFNYSEALNQGLQFVTTNYVLIISSHNVIQNENALLYGLNTFRLDKRIGAVYYTEEATPTLNTCFVNKTNFDGRNGLWNTCSLIDMALLRIRNFRRDVFAAEDQEWARWLFDTRNGVTARVSGAKLINHNIRARSWVKQRNDYVSIAYFSYPTLLKCRYILRIAFNVIRLKHQISIAERFSNLILCLRLVSCRFVKPKTHSRYF
jgi:glycosyltransferase involved in cell wall biosynthesis